MYFRMHRCAILFESLRSFRRFLYSGDGTAPNFHCLWVRGLNTCIMCFFFVCLKFDPFLNVWGMI